MKRMWGALAPILCLAAAVSSARATTFDLHIRAYCDPGSSYCGHGSQQAYKTYVLGAVQELNLQWQTTGISFRPKVFDIDQSNSVYEDLYTCDPPGTPQYDLFKQWRIDVAQANPAVISVILTQNANMCCSELPTNAAPAWDYYGIFCGAAPDSPYGLGSVLAHEMGHHFCQAHTFGYNAGTGSFMDTTDYVSGDDGLLDWDGDNERGPIWSVPDTPRDPGWLEAFDPNDPSAMGRDQDSNFAFVEGHEWCRADVVSTPGALDAFSPHTRYCNFSCLQQEVAGMPPQPFSLADPGYPPGAPRMAMSYHSSACRGPYVIAGARFESFTLGSVQDILTCYQTYRADELPDVCAGAGGDKDSDGICDQNDNCVTIKNTAQADLDKDGVGDACDFVIDNPGQVLDIDADGIGPFVDPDTDGDGCKDAQDQHPQDAQVVVGGILTFECGYGVEPVYRFEGVDSDGDGFLDCNDGDDDNDRICDEGGPLPPFSPGTGSAGCAADPSGADPCPTDLGSICEQFGPSGPCPPDWLLCFKGGCEEFFLKITLPELPGMEVVFEDFQIFGRALYVTRLPGRTLSESALALKGVFPTAGQQAAVTSGPVRLSIWSKATNTEVAVVAEYLPDDAALGDVTRGAFLAISPGGDPPGSSALGVAGTFARGLPPADGSPVDADDDAWPDPADNCTLAFNPGQTDADGDGFGNRCDADLDGDRIVSQSDLTAIEACDGADLTVEKPISEPASIQGFFQLPPNPIVLALAWSCRAADLDESGVVGPEDVSLARHALGLPPGPSGRQTETNLCVPGACDDGDPCTRDLCAPATGACHHIADTCDDGDPCTADTCEAGTGACSHDAVVCDDGDACTLDRCDPATGACAAAPGPDGAACDDGDLCTGGETCTSGVCRGGTTTTCDDGDPCTPDLCDPMTGGCVAGPPGCDDANTCTEDACGRSGCVHTPVADGTGCSDGDACTLGDACRTGQCLAAGSVSCDDGDFCTLDSCETATGECLREDRSCDDGDERTGDACDSGAGLCVNAPIPPPPPDSLVFLSPTRLAWQATLHAERWNTYRGTIPSELMSSPGRPLPYDHVCFESADLGGEGPTTTTDRTTPPPGTAFYYLVSGENGLTEGPTGDGPFQTPPNPCRTPP